MTRFIPLGVTCLALLLSVFSIPAAVAAPATTANDQAARMAAAADLLDAMGGRQSVMDQINRVIPAQMAALQTQFPSMTVETRKLIEKSMRDEMTNGVNHLLKQMAGAWANRFSADEMRQIAAFHRSPAGQRLRAQQEDLQREINEIGRNWGTDIGRRLQERLQQQMQTKPPSLTS
jgi:hypothetical protein